MENVLGGGACAVLLDGRFKNGLGCLYLSQEAGSVPLHRVLPETSESQKQKITSALYAVYYCKLICTN
jgi:hypothetical protein